MFLIFRLQRPYSLLELTHDPLPERYPISSFRLGHPESRGHGGYGQPGIPDFLDWPGQQDGVGEGGRAGGGSDVDVEAG